MERIKEFLKFYLLGAFSGFYIVLVFPMALMGILAGAMRPEYILKNGDWYYLVLFVFSLAIPVGIEYIAQNSKKLSKWEKLATDFVYGMTIFLTGLTAFLWYITDISRLESTITLFALVTAWITYLRSQRDKKLLVPIDIGLLNLSQIPLDALKAEIQKRDTDNAKSQQEE